MIDEAVARSVLRKVKALSENSHNISIRFNYISHSRFWELTKGKTGCKIKKKREADYETVF